MSRRRFIVLAIVIWLVTNVTPLSSSPYCCCAPWQAERDRRAGLSRRREAGAVELRLRPRPQRPRPYARTITSIILNGVRALRAWGTLAGMMMSWPSSTSCSTPPRVILTVPSKACTKAS